MKRLPVKGTNDFLPMETELRDYMQTTILNIYKKYGFERINTPIIEDIENLDKSNGGDNLNLIFKILKRGEKLRESICNEQYNDLADMGLRYDLTLPLSRFYANNKDKLISPFKCIQIGPVYRAERPQKGRMREFTQCDIDIIGSNSYFSEVELIDVTSKALLELGIKNFTILINDRRILNDIMLKCDFKEEDLQTVCVTFDKLDKIGKEGVIKELYSKKLQNDSIEKFNKFLDSLPLNIDDTIMYCQNEAIIHNLKKIIDCSRSIAQEQYKIEFDVSLVRGQGYYTGTVFEIRSDDFGSSIGGGGRYDGLIGKFNGENIPSVGFSIGFERIYSILSNNGYVVPTARKKIAILYKEENYMEALNLADEFRVNYDVSLVEETKKIGKTISTFEKNGYYGFINLSTTKQLKIF